MRITSIFDTYAAFLERVLNVGLLHDNIGIVLDATELVEELVRWVLEKEKVVMANLITFYSMMRWLCGYLSGKKMIGCNRLRMTI